MVALSSSTIDRAATPQLARQDIWAQGYPLNIPQNTAKKTQDKLAAHFCSVVQQHLRFTDLNWAENRLEFLL